MKTKKKKIAQKGQAIIAIIIVILIVAVGAYFLIFRKGKTPSGSSIISLLTIQSDKSDKIKLLGNQADPHTIWLGNKKGIRFYDETQGELMRITSDGKVGIGITSPTEKLTVNGSILASGSVIGSAVCLAGDCKTSWPTGSDAYWSNQEDNLYNLNPGNVGIGTQNPSEKLEVAGKIKAQAFCLGSDCKTSWPSGGGGSVDSLAWSKLTGFPGACPSGQFVRAVGSNLSCATPPAGGGGGGLSGGGAANYLAKWTGAYALANSLIYDNGTNVGIGTTQPSTRLSILSDVDNILKLVRSGTNYNYTWALGADGKLVLKDQASSIRLALDTSGNLGIGTASPGQKLEVAGYIKGTGLCIGSDCRTSWPSGGTGGGDINAVIAGNGLSGGGSSGDVTLSADSSYLQRRVANTCPAGSAIRAISVDGTVTCETVGGGGGGTLSGSGTAGNLARWLGTTSLGNSGIFQSGDNIGIGTTSPTYKLDVGGYVKGTGFCIGSDCITSWPSGGGGGVTSISASGGITASPNPITTTGTLSLATQNCTTPGQFVTGIGGTITCATPSGGGGGVTGSGTSNFIPAWNSSTSLTNSIIYYNPSGPGGGYIGIGTSGPAYKLDVAGAVKGTSLCIGSDCRTSWPGGGGGGISCVTVNNSCANYDCTVSCPSGSVTGGGCAVPPDNPLQHSAPWGQGWECAARYVPKSGETVRVWAICCN